MRKRLRNHSHNLLFGMKNPKSKGSRFERDVAKQLSLWWSGGQRDDIFYRSSSSGARATCRAVKNKNTANSAGDLSYLDASGKPFLECVAVEIKAGYKGATIPKIFSAKKPELYDFFDQAQESAIQANVPGWLVIHKQDFQPTMVYMNSWLFDRYFGMDVIDVGLDNLKFPSPLLFIRISDDRLVLCFKFDDFLKFDPSRFRMDVLCPDDT